MICQKRTVFSVVFTMVTFTRPSERLAMLAVGGSIIKEVEEQVNITSYKLNTFA